jgi:drug/metabolite transporter (DMT)-like permease
MGLFTSGALVNLLAGGLFCVLIRTRYGRWGRARELPKRYIFTCGAAYVLYTMSSYAATVIAQTRRQVLTVGVIKFAWPIFTLALAPIILKKKISRWIWISFALSLAGFLLVTLWGEGGRPSSFNALANGAAIASVSLAFVAAVAWSFFSTLTRKYLENTELDHDCSGYFMLASGVLMACALPFHPETRDIGIGVFAELIYQVVFTSLCATVFWSAAIRKGNVALVAAISNMLPVISVLAAALILGVKITPPVIIGSLLVTASIFSSGLLVKERADQTGV